MMGPRLGPVAAILATLVLAGGCSVTAPASESDAGDVADPGFGHVHGLALNPADGLVYAATHFGLFRLAEGSAPVRVGDRYQDTMGFTIAGPDEFLGSGHPDLREGGPPLLGMIRSEDRGETWQPLSLSGQVDFHALTVAGEVVYGWDATSGVVMRSDDGGITWQRGAEVAIADLTVDPAEPDRLLATTADGLIESTDGGDTFTLTSVQPPRPLIFIDRLTAVGADLAGMDASGGTWTSTSDGWAGTGELGGEPEAFTAVSAKDFLAATDEGVFQTADAGDTWTLLAATSVS